MSDKLEALADPGTNRRDDLLRRRARIWRRWERATGMRFALRTRAFWERSRPEDLAFAGQILLLLVLIPLELGLLGWDWEMWGLTAWVRGRGELLAGAFFAVWWWSAWRWMPVLPSKPEAIVAGIPLFGLPLAGSRGWLADRGRQTEAPRFQWRQGWSEIPQRTSIRDVNVLLFLGGGVALWFFGLTWLMDPQGHELWRRPLQWFTVILAHVVGWSATRTLIWLLPWPFPLAFFIRKLVGTRSSRARDASLTWHAFSATTGSRRWPRWELSGRELHEAWEQMPWILRWGGAGRASKREATRAERRRRNYTRWLRALTLPEAVLVGFSLAVFAELQAVGSRGELGPTVSMALVVSSILMIAGLSPGILHLGARILALTRRLAGAARKGFRLSLAVYLLTIGLLVGLLLGAGDKVRAGIVLVYGMALVNLTLGLAVMWPSFKSLLPGGESEEGHDTGFWWLVAASLGAQICGAMALRGPIGDLAAGLVFLTALVSPAIHYLLWRLS